MNATQTSRIETSKSIKFSWMFTYLNLGISKQMNDMRVFQSGNDRLPKHILRDDGGRRKRQLLVLFQIGFLLYSSLVLADQKLTIKYRSTPVDVDKPYFESLDTSDSSLVRGAWYDSKNEYLIINLSGTNYHYCGLDKGTWQQFKKSSSFGQAYLRFIKGQFDCRINPVPTYNR